MKLAYFILFGALEDTLIGFFFSFNNVMDEPPGRSAICKWFRIGMWIAVCIDWARKMTLKESTNT